MSVMKSRFDAKGYYDILGVSPLASDEEIKKNYRDIAKIWHPDFNNSDEALEKFQAISVAYDILKDDDKKLTYDLLSHVYRASNFPEMSSLKIYKNLNNQFDLGLRSLKQSKSISKVFSYKEDSEDLFCNYKEAKKIVLQNSMWNWVLGWWSFKGFFKNFGIISKNIKNIGNNLEDDFRLLVHNALAFYQEGKREEAFIYAMQAREIANPTQRDLLDRFILLVGVRSNAKYSKWNFAVLKRLQMVIPSMISALVVLSVLQARLDLSWVSKIFYKDGKIDYYKEIEHTWGGRGFDDMVVSKIFEIPVNLEDERLLYHAKDELVVLHGPHKKFDVLVKLERNETIRVTGYTPDKIWYRVMINNGAMGFVPLNSIKKGIGKNIPENSKIR